MARRRFPILSILRKAATIFPAENPRSDTEDVCLSLTECTLSNEYLQNTVDIDHEELFDSSRIQTPELLPTSEHKETIHAKIQLLKETTVSEQPLDRQWVVSPLISCYHHGMAHYGAVPLSWEFMKLGFQRSVMS